jgi:hypothetical protein
MVTERKYRTVKLVYVGITIISVVQDVPPSIDELSLMNLKIVYLN